MHLVAHVCVFFITLLIDNLVPMWPSGEFIMFKLLPIVHVRMCVYVRAGSTRYCRLYMCVYAYTGVLDLHAERGRLGALVALCDNRSQQSYPT